MDGTDRLKLGAALRYFGDGFQISKRIGGRRYWRVPVMDGEFLVEDSVGLTKSAVGGGNFLVLAESYAAGLAAIEAAVEAMRRVPNVILPFPGGIVRSGSKVGGKYKGMMASTNDAYCPTLRGRSGVDSQIPGGANSVLEIVIDGLDRASIEEAMRVGLAAACRPGVVEITAGNYGGKLGKFHFHLHQLLA
jgi:formylmethanofuran--tetrahydromethanopterin N-formyltransferase